MATSFDTTLAQLGVTRSSGIGAAAQAGASKDVSEMTSTDFITLMTAQMQNQDPFEPVDNSQMVAQMAQFSSLSSQSEMASTLKSIAAKLGATSTGDALAYVGRTVLTAGDTAYPRSDGGFAGAVELDGAATAVQLTIANANGEVVKTVALGAHPAGTLAYDWDGADAAGNAVVGGPFTVSVQARDGATTVGSRTLVWAPVTSVSMPAGADPVLTLPGVGQVATAAVRAIA